MRCYRMNKCDKKSTPSQFPTNNRNLRINGVKDV